MNEMKMVNSSKSLQGQFLVKFPDTAISPFLEKIDGALEYKTNVSKVT